MTNDVYFINSSSIAFNVLQIIAFGSIIANAVYDTIFNILARLFKIQK